MNRIYCSIWNSRTGTFVAAPEKTHARGKPSGTTLGVVASALIAQLFMSPIMAAEIVVARGNTQVFNAPNGVQAIDIATANSAGVSHNQYNKYNVGSSGLILNNNSPTSGVGPIQSQLGGQVVPNQNLAAEARLIINEVVAANRSTLAGYTEVVGRKADVVVANPWGITCNGCGFINTDRVTLSTGIPSFGGDGSLSGFSVNQGDILINGLGLDGRNQNIIDLLARSIKVDGQVNAKDLQVVSGSYSYNYGARTATPLTATGAVPLFAIDSTALGGMYANRIRFIATEAGVGVRMLGEAAASGDDFTISAAGKLEIHSKISAERDISLTYTGPGSGGNAALEISGGIAELAARRDIALRVQNSAGATFSNGKITAGQDLLLDAGSLTDSSTSASIRFSGRDNLVNTSGSISIDGPNWGAGGKLAMNMAALSVGNSGATFYSGSDTGASNRNLELIATAGGLQLNNASLLSGNDLILGGNGTDNLELGSNGSIKAANNIAASASTLISNSGSWVAGNQFVLQAADAQVTLNNSGTWQANGAMVLGSAGHLVDLSNLSSGIILANSLSITAAALSNAGAVQASAGATVTGSTFTNSGVSARFLLSTVAGGDGSLNFSGAVDNQGTLQSAGALSLTSGGTFTNSGNLFALHAAQGGSDEALTVTALRIDNSGVIDGGGALTLAGSDTVGNSINNSGSIQGGGATLFSVGNQMTNSSTGRIIGDSAITVTSAGSAFSLDNTGLIQATGRLVLGQSGHLLSLANAGTILTAADLDLSGGSVLNSGEVQAATGASVTGSTFTNSGVSARFLLSTVAGSDGNLNFSGAVDNQGTLQSAGGLSVASTSTLNNSGTIKASGSNDTLALSATTLTNTGNIDSGDLLNLTATSNSGTTLSNSGQIHSVDDMTIVTGGNVSNTASGKVLSDDLLSMTTGQSSFALSNAGRIQSGTSLTLGGAAHVVDLSNATSGILFGGSTLALSGANLDNQGKIYADAGATISVANLSNGNSSNANALIFGAMTIGSSTLTASGVLENYGAIHSIDNFSMSAGNIYNRNTGGLSSLATLALTATGSGSIDNSGALYAKSVVDINAVGGSIINRAITGTIDSDGSLTTNSANFTNNNTVVTNGNINITTTNAFVNETTLANGVSITKSLGGLENTNSYRDVDRLLNEGAVYSDAYIWVYEWNFDRQEQLNGISTNDLSTMPKAQIIANGVNISLNINYGSGTGRNYIAVISAPTVNISGAGTFTNEDLALYKYSYKTTPRYK